MIRDRSVKTDWEWWCKGIYREFYGLFSILHGNSFTPCCRLTGFMRNIANDSTSINFAFAKFSSLGDQCYYPWSCCFFSADSLGLSNEENMLTLTRKFWDFSVNKIKDFMNCKWAEIKLWTLNSGAFKQLSVLKLQFDWIYLHKFRPWNVKLPGLDEFAVATGLSANLMGLTWVKELLRYFIVWEYNCSQRCSLLLFCMRKNSFKATLPFYSEASLVLALK